MTTPWTASPVVEQIADTPFELTDGLEIDSGVLEAQGTDGGFIDEFDGTVVNSENWQTVSNVTIDNNMALFSGGSDGWGKRKLVTKSLKDPSTGLLQHSKYVFKIKRVLADSLVMFSPIQYSTQEYNIAIYIILYQYADGHAMVKTLINNVNREFVFSIADMTGLDFIYFVVSALPTYDTSRDNSYRYGFSIDNMSTIQWSNAVSIAYEFFVLQTYYGAESLWIDTASFLGYPTEATATLPEAEAYSVQSPATLAQVLTIQPNISTAGAGGVINLYVQHKSTEDTTWVSLSDVPNEWTDLGAIDGTAITLSSYLARTDDKFRFKLVYSGTGLVAYPQIDYITYTWQSDVVAPSAPVVNVAFAANETIAVVQFDALPSDAYAYQMDVSVNGSGSLPLSERNKIESGYNYLRLVGSQLNVERAGERNDLAIALRGFADGDVLDITSYARDDVGNVSAGTASTITLAAQSTIVLPGDLLEFDIFDDVIDMEVLP